jgi:hypothetical protein
MSRSSAGVLSTLIADRSGDTSQATQLFLLLVVRRTLQDGGKWDMRQGPEELMRRQLPTPAPGADVPVRALRG